jgi:hypothetical protein
MSRKPDYHISGYAGSGHPAVVAGQAKFGDLLVKTWHIGESSRDVEIAVWRSRMERKEASKVVIEDADHKVMEVICA